jgi:hypothetical protein
MPDKPRNICFCPTDGHECDCIVPCSLLKLEKIDLTTGDFENKTEKTIYTDERVGTSPSKEKI